MSDTVTNALNVGALTVAGTVAGMPLEALLLGAVAGGVVVGLTPPSTRRVGLLIVVTSALLAGSLAHHLADYAQDALLMREPPQAACSLLIGLCWPWLVRVVLPRAEALIDPLIERLRRMLGV